MENKKKEIKDREKNPKSSNKTKQANQKGQKHHTKEQYIKAIEKSNGIYANISRILKITRGSVSLFIKNHPELKELINQKRESWVDKAENELFNQIEFEDEEDPVPAARVRQKASKLIVTRLGKNRGWVEKHEQIIEHSGNISLSAKQLYDEIKRERKSNKKGD